MMIFINLLGTLHAFSQNLPVRDTVIPRVDSLKAAIVTAALRPRMKGDTMEYNTGNVRLRPHASVEELLGHLPGLEIDRDGNITFNGEPIQHLLVDGEDIFGSSPTLVTRNFDASKIARIQVLNRKNDQAVFTGIDDGIRTKTLNLVLKESEKNGYFGKMEAGGSTNGYYSSNAALAGFQNKEQFTALGIAANTGVLQASNTDKTGGASVGFANGVTDALNASAGIGIPQFEGVALHYANTWNGSENHAMANYQYSHYATHPTTTTRTLQTQPGSIYQQDQQSVSFNQQDLHWLYGTYDWILGNRTVFRLTFNGGIGQGTNTLQANSNSGINGDSVNSSQRSIDDNVRRQHINTELFWRTQIGRPERNFSISFNLHKLDAATNGSLYSLNKYYQPSGMLLGEDTIDQRKQVTDHPLTATGSINYTEPLSKGTILGLSFGISNSTGNTLESTYNKGNGKYQELVDSLSRHVRTQMTSRHATIIVQGKTKHLSYTVGSDLIFYNFVQRSLQIDSTKQMRYWNWTPRAIFNYTPGVTTTIGLSYNSSTLQPSIAQLQPVRNNSDPMHLILGNPSLRPGLVQNFLLDFHHLKVQIINLNLALSITSNSISMRTTTDSLGRQISQPVNVDGARTAAIKFSINSKVLGCEIRFLSFGNYSRNLSYINTDLSHNYVYNAGIGFGLIKTVPGRFNFQITTKFGYFDQISSINITAPIRYWMQNHTGTLTVYFLRNFEINTDATYSWQQKTSAFTGNTSTLLWNSSISRNFLQSRLVAKFQFNNMLDRNARISRNNTGNVNTETSTNILGRLLMLSVIYHFDWKTKKTN